MPAVYAVKNRDRNVRLSSTSGGVFRALAEHAIAAGAAVYGASFDESMRVVQRRATSMSECRSFSGSKYVQSATEGIFPQVRSDLLAGRPVLFSGTPCQVAGLQSFLEMNAVHGDLLTVDLVCHGVVSPELWAEHIAMLESRLGEPVRDFLFRDKACGWRRSGSAAVTDSGTVRGPWVHAFREVFDSNFALRPSCAECRFASCVRVGDITLGDYWGIENIHPEFDDDIGVSVVFANSPNGVKALAAIKHGLDVIPVRLVDTLQAPLMAPTPLSPRSEDFWTSYARFGYEKTLRRFTSAGRVRRIVRYVKRVLGSRQP